jgi:hypothetical protein
MYKQRRSTRSIFSACFVAHDTRPFHQLNLVDAIQGHTFSFQEESATYLS